MTSYQSFMPGSFRKLNQLTGSRYNVKNRSPFTIEVRTAECACFRQTYKALKTAENDPRYQSNTLRVSNIIQNYNCRGGKIKFGNAYLIYRDKPLIDILGSVEGQPGGSFSPLRNKF